MANMISIPGYSSDNRVPGFYFALDASKANTASVRRRVLLIGQMTGQGIATPYVSTQSAGVSSAQTQYGIGSQLALMIDAYRRIDRTGEVWILPLLDEEDSIAASGYLQLDGTVTQNGKLSFYIGDVLVEQPVANGSDAATVIQALGNRINSLTSVPVTAEIQDNKLVITARNAGDCGNDIALNVNLLGETAGQSIPLGLTVTINPMQGGVGTPTSLSDALAGLGNKQFDLFIHPYTDSESLALFTQFLDDRWQPTEQLMGHAITSFAGSYGQVTAMAEGVNSQHLTIMATSDSPTHPMLWTAQIGAQVAVSIRDNPAIPITGLLLSVMPPSDNGVFLYDMRNSLLYDGISTFNVVNNNQVTIERLITTYTRNAYGTDDDSYLNIETILTAAFALEDMRQYLSTQFARCVLLPDGSKISAGQPATTAQLIGKSCAARYRMQSENLWTQNPARFAKDIQSENAGNGMVRLLMPYQFSDQLFMIAGNCQFIKTQ